MKIGSIHYGIPQFVPGSQRALIDSNSAISAIAKRLATAYSNCGFILDLVTGFILDLKEIKLSFC